MYYMKIPIKFTIKNHSPSFPLAFTTDHYGTASIDQTSKKDNPPSKKQNNQKMRSTRARHATSDRAKHQKVNLNSVTLTAHTDTKECNAMQVIVDRR